jgi:cyanophycinase
MADGRGGPLYVIGGHEALRGDDDTILADLARCCRDGPVLLVSVASREPEDLVADYRRALGRLGLHVDGLDVRDRDDARDPSIVARVGEAAAVFFTGGDQARLVRELDGTPLLGAIRAAHRRGVPVAGTSAGAAAMSPTMLVAGEGRTTPDLRDVDLEPGLGLLDGVLVDTHFAERGRIGRLLAALVKSPDFVAIGLDEDTAVVVGSDGLRVLGTGAAYVIDARRARPAPPDLARRGGHLRLRDVTLHVLSVGDTLAREELP